MIVMMMMTTTTMMMMMVMMMMMMIIIITTITTTTTTTITKILKGAFGDFLLIGPRTVSSTYPQVAKAQSCANHVEHIKRLSRATCRVPRGKKGQLSCKV